MASGPPEISSDNKTITVHMREGVKFSPPVNREVTAEDVAYAFQRATNPNIANPYVGAYFKSIEGEPEAEKEGGKKPIKGITTPNKHTIVFKLTEPKAQIVAAALVMPISAAVPKEYAEKYDKNKPSNYAAYQVATGPYMIKNDSSGKVLGRRLLPGQVAHAGSQPELEREHRHPAGLPERNPDQDRRQQRGHRPPGAGRQQRRPERTADAGERPARGRKVTRTSW